MKTTRKQSYFNLFLLIPLLMLGSPSMATSQSRIQYNGLPLFMSGANVAWVNFAADVGPSATNFNAFRTMFDSVRACGGNVMRLWLHTDGSTSPAFNSAGIVTDPGTNTISDLQQILDLAWQRRVGLILCLWSFDMMRQSLGSVITNRSGLMLTDISARTAYIQNALIPMVTALKGHPGIVAWEVFNEAEGMSTEYGWDGFSRVPMSAIQAFVNVVAGAIHRTDPSAMVTTGAWSFIALADVTVPAKVADLQTRLQVMPQEEKAAIEEEFSARYNISLPVDVILSHFEVAANVNYYRDDRLIAAGGDAQGTLDFYTVHYYDWGGTALSPFHHPYAQWNLTKPLIVAEFFAQAFFGFAYQDLYRILFTTGYAGALTWQWINGTQQTRTRALMRDLSSLYRVDLEVEQIPGTIYSFKASPPTVQPGQPSTLSWTSASGSTVTLNGTPVPPRGEMTVTPSTTTGYILAATGSVNSTSNVTVTTLVTDVSDSRPDRPTNFALLQNYPNPFNPSTTVAFMLPARSHVTVTVYNLLGVEVTRLVDGQLDVGYHSAVWEGNVPSGIYFCRMNAHALDGPATSYQQLIRMTLVR